MGVFTLSFPTAWLILLSLSEAAFTNTQTKLWVWHRSPTRGLNEHKVPRASATEATSPTLSGNPWRLALSLTLPDTAGNIVSRSMAMTVNFVVDEGYEPPQGRIVPVTNSDDASIFVDASARSRWQLSEDPDDRRDGFWIWGLFEEPLYPFLLFNICFNDISLPGDGEVIPGFTMFSQIDHLCDRKTGSVTLKEGIATVRVMKTVNADLAGLATAEIAESQTVGNIRFTPLLRHI